jgi:hypothetical protein
VPETILDPETGFPFAGNRIPSSRLHPAGLAFARLFPRPNVPGATIQNYRAVGKLETAADAFGLRLDHRFTASDEAFLEYQFNRDTTDDPLNLLSGITNLPSFGARDALQTHTLRMNNTHVFTPSVIHQVRFSMNYLKQPRTILKSSTSPGPAILITGLSNLGHATNLPQERRNRSYELLNDVSWQRASSVTKIGTAFLCTAAGSISSPEVSSPAMPLQTCCSVFRRTRFASRGTPRERSEPGLPAPISSTIGA